VNGGIQVYTTQQGFSNYVWTISQGGTIVSGQGTYQIEVDWLQGGNRNVTANYETQYGCTADTPATFNVNVMGLPGNAGPVQGDHDICTEEISVHGENICGAGQSSPPFNVHVTPIPNDGKFTASITVPDQKSFGY
jgi:hypothetical protein